MLTQEQIVAMQQEIESLKAQNEALKTAKKSKEPSLTFQVSEKGGVSIYGLGRFPVTLYAKQWHKLFNVIEELKDFIRVNDAILTKDKTTKLTVVKSA
jgi:hypothetical protein